MVSISPSAEHKLDGGDGGLHKQEADGSCLLARHIDAPMAWHGPRSAVCRMFGGSRTTPHCEPATQRGPSDGERLQPGASRAHSMEVKPVHVYGSKTSSSARRVAAAGAA